MPEEHLINSVNKHYLDKVMRLAEQADIKATEDIFDARGMKLVAKGARISRSLQEKLSLRRLSKPFESSIAVESGVDISIIATEAQRIADMVEPVRSVMKTVSGGQSPLQVLESIQFGSAMSTMLTIIERGGATALEHSVMVSLQQRRTGCVPECGSRHIRGAQRRDTVRSGGRDQRNRMALARRCARFVAAGVSARRAGNRSAAASNAPGRVPVPASGRRPLRSPR